MAKRGSRRVAPKASEGQLKKRYTTELPHYPMAATVNPPIFPVDLLDLLGRCHQTGCAQIYE